MRSSFESVGFFDEFGDDNRLSAQIDPNTYHIREYIKDEKLLKEHVEVIKANKRKRIKMDEM